MLASAAYDAEKRILHLRFRSGDVYRYFDSPAKEYQQFLGAESRGRYFLSSIRNCFPYERMAKLKVACLVKTAFITRLPIESESAHSNLRRPYRRQSLAADTKTALRE